MASKYVALNSACSHRGHPFRRPVNFTSLESLKAWIARQTDVDQSHQILMTARGKQVKAQTLQTEQEIFLYDRRLLAAKPTNARSPHSRNPSFTRPTLPTPPKSISQDATLRSWQKLFRERQKWAAQVGEDSRRTVEEILDLVQERHVVQRGTGIAVTNIKQHLESLRPKYDETKSWADQICEDQRFLLEHWPDRLEKIRTIRANGRLTPFLQNKKKTHLSERLSHTDFTLHDLIDPEEVKAAGSESQDLYEKFSDQVADVKRAHDHVFSESDRIAKEFEDLSTFSDSDIGNRADGLIEEVEVLVGKLTANNEAIQKLPDTPKSLAQASKTSHLHDSSFVKSLTETNEEIGALLQQITQLKADIKKSSVQHLQQISVIESSIQSMHSLLANLNIDSKTSQVFETLNFVVRLPATYGSLLVESVRRYEYSTRGSSGDSTTIAKADENKRRQRWAREMGDALNILSFDEATSGHQESWPAVKRQDIEDYFLQLEQVDGLDEAVKEVKDFYNSLPSSSRPPPRRESRFKNGSLHEADHERSLTVPRVSDEIITSMKKDRAKAEERIRSAEGRVRRLETLLAQKSHTSRPSSMIVGLEGGSTPTFERQASSPIPNFTSALSKAREPPDLLRTATSSRRVSFNANNGDSDNQKLAKRVVSLEAELLASKQEPKDFEKQSSGRTIAEEMLKEQAQDAIKTKEDLLGNLEAQKQEFEHDRLIFGGEIKKLKIRIEELEDENDRICQSQEHDFKIQSLTEDIDNVKRDAASEVRRARQETEEARQAYLTSRDNTNQMNRELRRLSEEKSQFQSQAEEQVMQMRGRDQALADHHRALRTALLHVSNEEAPEDFALLVESIENAAEKIAAHRNSLESTLQGFKDDNGALNTRLNSQQDEIYDLRERTGNEERQKHSLREELERVLIQLESAQKEQQELVSRMATESTEARDLRDRIQSEEQKSEDLHSQVGGLDDRVKRLLSELDEKRSEMASLEGSYVRLKSNRDAQASRADEISKRLLVQNLTIQHLLEQVGFSVTRQDESTVIQKVSSKTTSASTTLGDPSATMKRSISGPLPTRSDLESMVGPDVLHWAKIEDSDQASKSYDEFINSAVNFDMDVFYETLYKRIKEVEHIARKGQRDARAYRDKAHRAQSDAHERLALRNFKEGDLALFLPTRDQATKPWAAFNVGAPHYFLREQDSHKLSKRDWLIARISKVEKRVVDLSKSINGMKLDERITNNDENSGGAIIDDENPYELSDGLVWFLIEAAEEKPGAPINIGLGKTTVASVNVDAKGSIRMKKAIDGNGATHTLTRSLDSRRSSTNSKKGLVAIPSNSAALEGMAEGAKSPNLAPIEIADAEDTSRPESSRNLAVPQSRENREEQEQVRSTTTSPSKSLRELKSLPQKPLASPEKRKSKAWDALWSLDLNLESGKGKDKHK